jgi:hypothetical protein
VGGPGQVRDSEKEETKEKKKMRGKQDKEKNGGPKVPWPVSRRYVKPPGISRKRRRKRRKQV